MQMPEPSEEDKEPMFGNLGAFVNGNMFAGLFGPTIGVKLSDADRAALEAEEVTQPFGPEERPMGGYVGLPEAWNSDAAQAEPWVARAFAHVAEFPPKAPKAKANKPKK
ncbi:TfoX/Sxy family protein [Paenarthrobacter ureafaciens]|uniref:TfoX/Sxy family protein n=1 Tax=Paenarthrobacter ureafaciens TaxID=37931 RepID=A0AAX3EL58_PAEUR|nr:MULTISPECIES: TfoX/Sxy family protein [Paenarthrobacter]NKR12244.1 hypothetical protein [Arthrobacter sp. M5]NKR17267.1 hypothetical protein [Arthrobacter sp. M6]OEH59744.1 hypothetical protein A5N17_17735 [Arthrobacter sp. D2]OEH63672.1 hypothetical protein A5N13_14380 [Arthrobacter sp. D4]MBN9131544.1 TfoX/Sxy family protein [Paenarthrobacter ureafaciens]